MLPNRLPTSNSVDGCIVVFIARARGPVEMAVEMLPLYGNPAVSPRLGGQEATAKCLDGVAHLGRLGIAARGDQVDADRRRLPRRQQHQ